MSVPKDKRSAGQLAVNVEARSICAYVLKITENEKYFPKEQSWFTEKLKQTAINIDISCWKANNIYVSSEALYQKRLALEAEDGDACTVMLELINIGKQI